MTFDDLRHRILRLGSDADVTQEQAEREARRLGALAARRYRWYADQHVTEFDPKFCAPVLTDDPLNNEDLWWLTWRMIVQALSTTFAAELPANFDAQLSTRLPSSSSLLSVFGMKLDARAWRERLEDYAAALGLLAQLSGELSAGPAAGIGAAPKVRAHRRRRRNKYDAAVDRSLVEDWNRAKDSGITRQQFAADRRQTVKHLTDAQARERKRRQQANQHH